MTNSEKIDEIDWLLSVVRPGFIRKIDQRLSIESLGITVEQATESIRAELCAERRRLIGLSSQ